MVHIRIHTEQVRNAGRQFHAKSDQLNDINSALQSAINALDTWAWDGRSRADAEPMLDQVHPENRNLADELERLGRMLQRVAERFEHEDGNAARDLEDLPWVKWDPSDNLTMTQDQIIELNRKTIQEKWDAMTLDERKKWLEDWYKQLCQEWGIPPTDFNFADLKEGTRGQFSPGFLFGLFRSITIDVDNVNGDDPFVVLTTIAHETRHQYQQYLVENPDKRPDHITAEQIKAWEDNINNYVKPEDDFEGYRKQPIEQDAREAGDQAVDIYLGSGEVAI